MSQVEKQTSARPRINGGHLKAGRVELYRDRMSLSSPEENHANFRQGNGRESNLYKGLGPDAAIVRLTRAGAIQENACALLLKFVYECPHLAS